MGRRVTSRQVRALAQETGPGAKIVIANGLDLDELDPHYFKSIPSYYAVANLYDNMFSYDYLTQEDGGLFPVAGGGRRAGSCCRGWRSRGRSPTTA